MKTSNTTVIQGATFSRVGLVKLPAGTWSVAGSIKTQSGNLVADFDCTLAAITPDSSGNNYSVLLEVPSTSTVDWPVDTLVADLKFSDLSDPPVVIISNRFNILVQQAV